MTPPAVRILIVDDHELVRGGLISILAAGHPEWEIAGEASNGADAIELGTSLKPGVAILDLALPDQTGLQVAERLLEAVPGIRILVLSRHGAAPILDQLRKAGVHAYLVKNEAPRVLVSAVERVLAGESFFASDASYRSERELDSTEYIPVQFLLTPRELTVLKLLALGRSNKELAGDLDISVRTAETHRARILDKLEAETLGDLVRMAIRDNVI
jgi:two-component system, NarL family, nitrate/nitrite response regulator NarL